jgi:parallel beta-helix repeat protein
MEKGGRFLVIAIFFLFFIIISTAQGAWDNDDLMYANVLGTTGGPVHNIDTEEDFKYIQEAIADPDTKDGDTISVDAGIYRERVVINKQLKLIGANKDTTIIDGGGSGNCIKVTADNVEISGFTIKNGNYGVYLESSNCRVTDNYITSIDFDGISLRSNSVNNTIANNSLSKVKRRGIDLSSSSNNRIHDNDLSDNGKGISLSSSHSNIFYHNRLTNNSNCGISLTFSKNNIIRDNDLSGSDKGIDLSSSDKNCIYHNNFIDNRNQAKDNRDTNRWDNGREDGGNYWSDHECTGNPSDGNQPYDISSRGATDLYPFMDKDGWTCTPPSPPTLTDPGTSDNDGNYIVSWSSVSSAINYTLEEDTNSLFSSPTIVYSESETSKEITGMSDGTYYYQVKACNECGCSEWSNKENITIDTIPPTVNIRYPSSEQMFNTTTITVNGNASDNVAVGKVEVKVESGSWQTASGTTSWSTSVTLVPGDLNTIYASATDTAGNINQTSVTVFCDIIPPVIYHENITSATEGESIPISATITDDTKVANASLSYRISGEEAWITTPMDHIGDNYSATIPESHVTTAGVEYYIEAVDDVSNTANKPVTAPTTPYSITVITIDTIPPTVNIMYPTSGQMFNTTTITVNGNASDNVAVIKVEVQVGSGDWQIASGTTSWNTSVTLVPGGSNTINASAADTSENSKNTSVTVICDMTPPDSYHEPITTATEGENISIFANITDDTTKVASALLFYRITGEEAWTSTPMIPTGNIYSATIPASHVTTAGVEYYIEAVDDTANTAYKPATAPEATYSITIKVNVGYAIIIAGRRDKDIGHKPINISAYNAYEVLLNRCFTNERIFYLNPSKGQGVDNISSSKKIDDAISWAHDNVSANVPLLIYMVGHCENNAFIVNGTKDILTASSLNNFLNLLTNEKGCDDITVVCEACNSGNFIDDLSRRGRIIVTSADVDADAFFDEEGAQFSLDFFNSISNNKTIKDAFNSASNNSFLIHWGINPLLDDNGDKDGHEAPLPNDGDGYVAKSKYIGIQENSHPSNNWIPATN